jgi:putative salt-induced outer membrane protein YdiY
MKISGSAVWVCAAVALATATARADVIELADGSRIVGTIELVHEGKATIVTGFAGKLVLDVASIKSVSTDAKVNVGVTSGDVLVGPVKPAEDGGTVASEVGDINFRVGELSAIWPDGTLSPEARALEPKWTTTLEAGVISTEGNTDTLNANGRFDMRRKTSEDLLQFYATVTYAEQDDERSRNEYIGGVYYENNISKKLYWYTRFELEHDEFEDLDIRATAAAGVGYYWVQEEIREFKTRVGAGYRHESYDDGGSRNDPILDLGYDYRRQLAKWAEFTHGLTYSPNVEDFGEYRVVTDANLIFPIGTEDIWKFKVGVKKEYNSNPASGRDRLDSTFYSNIVLQIK